MDDLDLGSTGKSVEQKDMENKLDNLKKLKGSDTLEKYASQKEELQKKEDKLKSVKTPGIEDFDRDAGQTLDTLVSLGYDELGQDGLDALIEAMNYKNKGSITPIQLDDVPGLEKTQETSLRELTENLRKRSGQGELRIAMQELARGLRDEGWRSKHWDTPEKRAKFLYQEEEKTSEST